MAKGPAFRGIYLQSIGEADREVTNISEQVILDFHGVTERTEEICPRTLESLEPPDGFEPPTISLQITK